MDKPLLETLRKNLDHAIIDRGIRSRKELARAAGVNPDTLDNLWKQSRKNSLYADDLLLLAKHLNMSMEELLTSEKPDYQIEDTRDPVVKEIEKVAETLEHEQLVELRGVVRSYVDRYMTSDDYRERAQDAG